MVVAQHCEYIKCHWIIHFKMVDLMLCKFHLNKLFLKYAKIAQNWQTLKKGIPQMEIVVVAWGSRSDLFLKS